MTQLAGQTISHFEIVEVVGEGGMGVVYRARDITLDRDIALKFLPGHLVDSEESTRRFHNEAKSISALDHPNICTIHGYGEHQGQPYIAMSLVDGQTLEERLREGTVSMEQAVEIARQIAKGLSAAHAKGIIHRDLKPANIMIDSHSVVKIMDFGLARRQGGDEITQSGSTLGTLSYMSPEQVRGEAVDARTDLWSLGVIVYEMVLRKRPFTAKYDAAVMHLILSEEPEKIEALRAISVPLFNFVENLLEKDREDRPRSADSTVDDLNKISSQHVSLTVKGKPSAASMEIPEAQTSRFFRVLRKRRFLPIVGSYSAVAIGLMEVVPYLIDQYQMDPGWHQILLIWVITGFPLAGLIAYFHGRKGRDRISRPEVVLFATVLLVSAGLSFASWQGSRGANNPVAEQSVMQSAQAGVDFADLRTSLTAIRSQMLNEKLAAEKANAAAMVKNLFDQGLAHEQNGDELYTVGTGESLTAAIRAYESARDAFKQAESEAQIVAKNQNAARRERNVRRDAENARSRMVNKKITVGGDSKTKATLSEFTQAQRRESDARTAFENGDYPRAKTLYDEAERLYRNAATKITAKGAADTAKGRMSSAKAGVISDKRASSEYKAGIAAQNEGESAYLALKFSEAEKHFQIAHRLFTEAGTKAAAPTQPSVNQNQAIAAISALIKRHESYVASGNLQGLRQIGAATDMWEQSRFFESTEDRKVQSQPNITIQSPNTATVELSVVINFSIKNQSQDPLRFNRLWQLRATNGRWAIISDTKAN